MIAVRALAIALLIASSSAMAAPSDDAPSLAGFEDAIHHWRNVHGDAYPRYAPDQVASIADNILRYQRIDGGWMTGKRLGEWFPQQSVSKLWVALTVLDQRALGHFQHHNITFVLDRFGDVGFLAIETVIGLGDLEALATGCRRFDRGRDRGDCRGRCGAVAQAVAPASRLPPRQCSGNPRRWRCTAC